VRSCSSVQKKVVSRNSLVTNALKPHLKTEMYWIQESQLGIESRFAKKPPNRMKGMMAIGAIETAASAFGSMHPSKSPMEVEDKVRQKTVRKKRKKWEAEELLNPMIQ